MKKFFIFSAFLISFLIYGLFVSQYNFLAVDTSLSSQNPEGYYDYRGVTHSHSDLSTGSRNQDEINHEAQKANLDFLIHTELNYFSQRTRTEGYFNKLLVLQADEFSYLDSHIIVYPADSKHHFSGLGETQVFLADVLSKKSSEKNSDLIALAHPFKDGSTWSGEYPEGLNGVEVLNLKSIWQNAWRESKLSFLWSILIYPFNSRLALLRIYDAPERELQLWDKINSRFQSVGLLGNDATARLSSIGKNFFRFPSYQESFSIASNHVLLGSELTGDFESDRNKILHALNNGNFYLCMDLLGDPKGFIAEIKANANSYLPGSTIRLKEQPWLYVKLPKTPRFPFEVQVFQNGKLMKTFNEPSITMELTEKGSYRIAVRVIPTLPLPDGKRWFSWIFTNPFTVE
ncbi:MAG: hypothetical protein A4S09_01925 [Proteobacteria bacterium SG_bin7]|nr:MAG: hypothetical protein A4S09_01925 [Proteobacteria bacterium SG_bin7]